MYATAWPCDDAATKFELLCAELLGKTYPNGLWYEPDENALENVLSTSASGGQPRMLDLGKPQPFLHPCARSVMSLF